MYYKVKNAAFIIMGIATVIGAVFIMIFENAEAGLLSIGIGLAIMVVLWVIGVLISIADGVKAVKDKVDKKK